VNVAAGIGERSPEYRRPAFTLIEIVVALTIIAVVAAVAIPTVKGLGRAEAARAPIATLAEMVQEVRHRAMRGREPFQIVFEREGIHASPAMYPYEKRDEFLKELETLRAPPPSEGFDRVIVERTEMQVQEVTGGASDKELLPAPAEEEWRWEPPWTWSIPLAQGTECEVLMWGDGEWEVMEGDKMRRWVFQPSGMASPARVRLRTGELELEAGFDVLTGELTRERAAQPPAKP
jgi:prepilin-type N-terminal cleavage/methylation domain-containing protein